MKIELAQTPICEHPVFVVGSPRSGTSILPWSLAQHSAFWTSRESDLLYNLFGRKFPGEQKPYLEEVFLKARDRPEGAWLQEHGVGLPELLEYLGVGLNALFTSRSHPRRWIDQTPVNTLMLDSLAYLFPGAYFLHILRDGRRVVHSMLNFGNRLTDETRLEMVKQGTYPEWASGPTEAARTWKVFVQAALAFETRHPDRCLAVVNEKLSANPEEGFHRILEFLGAPYESAPAEYFRTHRINSSFEGRPDPGKEPWKEWPGDQLSAVNDEAGNLLMELGFAGAEELRSCVDRGAEPVAVPGVNESVISRPDTPKMTGPWIKAEPNPVPFGPGDGTTTISWNTGNGSMAQVYVLLPGRPETLFTAGQHGSKAATWILTGFRYVFLLYAGEEHKKVLAWVTVTRK